MIKKQYRLYLREQVIEYIKLGNDQNMTPKIFKISKNSVNKWWIRYQEAGAIRAKSRLGSKDKIDPEKLRGYVEINEDKK
ncbi:transposase [Holospora obtusa F1]|uniref:Transposase n=1 Tax=Holospora obtusa F1 TaxID=1399147 RepID=W6TGF6_HOLOB|nr:IS630 transposase-related protein [Holospora obtusa]ETZ06940.1 transposase [Holospora obtusa F1]